jgi:hypothetical protein
MSAFYVAGSCVATTQHHAFTPVGGGPSGIRAGSRPAACTGCGARHLQDGSRAVTCTVNSQHVIISCRACGKLTVDGKPFTPCPRCDNSGAVPGDTDSGCIDCPDCEGSGALEVRS